MRAILIRSRHWLAARDSVERGYLKVGCAVLSVSAIQMIKGFWFLIPADPLTGLFVLGVGLVTLVYMIRGLGRLARCIRSDRNLLRSRLICVLGLAGAVVVFPLVDPYFQGARLRFWLQGGEAAYLRFAAKARREQPPDLTPSKAIISTLDQYREREQLEARRVADFHARLGRELLDHNPTSWERVGVASDKVQLWSGSGLTGSWGIEIYDRPVIPPKNSKDAVAENPYLHRQKPMSERVWFWTSD